MNSMLSAMSEKAYADDDVAYSSVPVPAYAAHLIIT